MPIERYGSLTQLSDKEDLLNDNCSYFRNTQWGLRRPAGRLGPGLNYQRTRLVRRATETSRGCITGCL